MKKIVIILTLALALLALSACKVNVVLGDIAQQLHEANTQSNEDAGNDGDAAGAQDASPADAAEPATSADDGETAEAGTEEEFAEPASSSDSTAEAVPEEPAQAPADVSAPADLTSLSLDQLVADADGTGGQLPEILPDCPGADWINDDIQGTFGYLVGSDSCTLWYDANKTGRVLSVLIAQNYDGDSSYYTPYNLDLATGEYLTGQELLALLGAEQTVLGDTELDLMAGEFEVLYGGMSDGDDAALYQEQYGRTTANDNAEFDRVWLGFGGELCFVARIYSMAGAEFYEYPMSTGLYYG